MGEPAKGMMDMSGRKESQRRAVAEGYLVAAPEAIEALRRNSLPKADPLPTARAAALLAVKATPQPHPALPPHSRDRC